MFSSFGTVYIFTTRHDNKKLEVVSCFLHLEQFIYLQQGMIIKSWKLHHVF